MKKDPSNHEKKYKTWQDRINGEIPGINKTDSDIILRYISDMENDINISTMSAKGGRSYARLNNLRQRMIWFSKKIKEKDKGNPLSCFKKIAYIFTPN